MTPPIRAPPAASSASLRRSPGPEPRATYSRHAYQPTSASAAPRIAAAMTKCSSLRALPSISSVSLATVSAANSTMAP